MSHDETGTDDLAARVEAWLDQLAALGDDYGSAPTEPDAENVDRTGCMAV